MFKDHTPFNNICVLPVQDHLLLLSPCYHQPQHIVALFSERSLPDHQPFWFVWQKKASSVCALKKYLFLKTA